MPQPLHRVPGARRRLIASVIAVAAIGSALGVMGVALASQPPSPVMPARSLPADTAPPTARTAEIPPPPVADLGGAPLHAVADDSWTRRSVTHGAAERADGAADPAHGAADPADGAADPAVGVVLPASEPVSLAIPSIGVDSPVRDLGQDADGGLEVPRPGPHYDEAAWYRYSPTPGELGPSVLLGHIDSAANGPSVFFRLGELEAGDEIAVTRADGSTAVFAVDAVHRYAKADFPTELVYGDIDHAGLRILTCGGAFDRAARSYVDNIVVFASLV